MYHSMFEPNELCEKCGYFYTDDSGYCFFASAWVLRSVWAFYTCSFLLNFWKGFIVGAMF